MLIGGAITAATAGAAAPAAGVARFFVVLGVMLVAAKLAATLLEARS